MVLNLNSTDKAISGAGVFVISGPTAVGKGTVVKTLIKKYPQLYLSISATTRPPRPGEIDGIHYHFISQTQFDELIESNGLLEWATVHGKHRYGTPAAPVTAALAQQRSTILEIDLQGARQVRKTLPDALQIFLTPPSWSELVNRLSNRGFETEEQMQRRLQTARQELAAIKEFDVVIQNFTVEQTVAKLVQLMGLPD